MMYTGVHGNLRRHPAFTLVEILVTISIVALLVGILIPTLGDARRQAKGSVCAGNLHFVGLASAMYLDDHAGAYWPSYVQDDGGRWWG
ncbi:MAG: type II secretion system protein, partial [Planctomycetes bacterium]|nr:type II secretion system protein [Planctomycetota bacterium]